MTDTNKRQANDIEPWIIQALTLERMQPLMVYIQKFIPNMKVVCSQ